MMTVRHYQPSDYEQVALLYKRSELYGGQYDEHRDSEDRLRKRVEADADAILVAEEGGTIVGTVSLVEDGRVAWLYRFCVIPGEGDAAVAKALCDEALGAVFRKGHRQALVYAPADNAALHRRYEGLGFQKGGEYACFWKDLEVPKA